MHRNIEILLGRLVTDPELRRVFGDQPHQTLREQGLELTATELEALAATDPDALRALAAALDARLRRASRASSAGDGEPLPSPAPSQEIRP